MSRSSDNFLVRDVMPALMMTQTEGAKILRASTSLIRCMMFFDLCYLITGISLITVGLTNEYSAREKMIYLGGAFGIAASISALCNSFAAHGLRRWRRSLLMPWLLYYLIVLCLMVMFLAQSFYTEHLTLRQVFLFLICVTLFSCWRHMQKQFMLMAFPRPQQVVVDVEAVVRDLIGQSPLAASARTSGPAPGKDLPPKYEELEDLPPTYDPTTMPSQQQVNLPTEATSSDTAQGAAGGASAQAAK